MKNRKIKKPKNSKGFTIIEMLVAVFIFSLITGAISGVFISGLRGQRKSLSSQELLGQTSYVMEYTSRALRMAKKEQSAPACLSANGLNYEKFTRLGGNEEGIRFLNYKDECQEFYLDKSVKILKEGKAGSYNDLTSDNLKIAAFNIGPDESWSQDDDLQPRVTIFLEIEGKEQSKIKIQTTISQRNLDITM